MNKDYTIIQPACVTLSVDPNQHYMNLETRSITMEPPKVIKPKPEQSTSPKSKHDQPKPTISKPFIHKTITQKSIQATSYSPKPELSVLNQQKSEQSTRVKPSTSSQSAHGVFEADTTKHVNVKVSEGTAEVVVSKPRSNAPTVKPVRSRKGTKSDGAQISPSASRTWLTASINKGEKTKEQVSDTRIRPQEPITLVHKSTTTEKHTMQHESSSSESTVKQHVRLTKSNPEEKSDEKSVILEQFQEQARAFQQTHLTVQKPTPKQRSVSPSPSPQRVGLDHLDNLVKLMEQLSQLRDENSSLKRRCAYLESAKSLLQAKSLMAEDSDISLSPQSKHTPRVHSDIPRRKRVASVEDTSLTDTNLSLTIKRSYSTGSINLPEFVIEETEVELDDEEEQYLKNNKHKKSSKWSTKVKNVLKGQKSEDVEESIIVSSSHSLLSAPRMEISESRSMDSGVGSGPECLDSFRLSSTPIDIPNFQNKSVYTEAKSHESDDDLCTEIWMGPPGWESTTTDHDEFITKDSVNTFLAPIHRSRDDEVVNPQYLEISVELPRRSSSPSFTMYMEEEKQENKIDQFKEAAPIHRTTSSKSEGNGDFDIETKTEKKSKTAWSRVKDIITHKDSMKKRHRKLEKYDSESAVTLTTFVETDVTPVKRYSQDSSKKSVKGKKCEDIPSISVVTAEPIGGTPVDINQLMGSLTDDFNKKMAEWETKKSKKFAGSQSEPSSFGDSSEFCSDPLPTKHSGERSGFEDAIKSSYSSFTKKLQAWERMKSQKFGSPTMERRFRSFKRDDQKSKKSKPERDKERVERQREKTYHKVEREQQKLEREKSRLDKERLRALEHEAKIEKMKERLGSGSEAVANNPIIKPLSEYKVTSDFARKLHEWELIKGVSKDASTALYLEVQKRSMELAQEMYGDTRFMTYTQRKHERRYRKKMSASERTTDEECQKLDDCYPDEDAKSPCLPDTTEASQSSSSSFVAFRETKSCSKSEPTSPVRKTFTESTLSEESVAEETQEDIQTINNNIASMEKANTHLLEQLSQKKGDYVATQLEVRALSEKLGNMKSYHDKALAEYENEVGKEEAHGKVSLDTTVTTKTLAELEGKIRELQNFGEKMSLSMEGAMMCKFQSIEGEESVGARLMDLVRQMKAMLIKETEQDGGTPKPSPMQENFKHLYGQAMQLQIQMNNLRLSKLERNKEILDMKRELLLQEVTNLLLQVDITRREAELLRYKAARHKTLKRSNTYNGHDGARPKVESECRGEKRLDKRRYSIDLLPLFEVSGQPTDEEEKQSEQHEEGVTQLMNLPAPKLPRDSTTSADSTEMSSAKSCDSINEPDDETFTVSPRRFRAIEKPHLKKKRDLSLPASYENSLDDFLSIADLDRPDTRSRTGVKPVGHETDSGFKSDSSPRIKGAFSFQQTKQFNDSVDESSFEQKDSVTDLTTVADRKSGKVIFLLGASTSIDNVNGCEDENIHLEAEIDSLDSQSDSSRFKIMEKERTHRSGSLSLPMRLPSSPVMRCKNKQQKSSSAHVSLHKISDDFLRLSKNTPPRSQFISKHLRKQKCIEDSDIGDKCRSQNAFALDKLSREDSVNVDVSPEDIADHKVQSLDTLHGSTSPSLNLGHIGLVSPVKTLKPASQLIEDSRRHHHRIVTVPHDYNQSESCEVLTARSSSDHSSLPEGVDKENLYEFSNIQSTSDDKLLESESDVALVHMVKRGSVKKISKTDSLSSDAQTSKSTKPLQDLTNDENVTPQNKTYLTSSPITCATDADSESITSEKIPILSPSSPKITAKSKKEKSSPTPYSSHSLFHRRKKKSYAVTFDEGAFSDSDVKPTRYSKRTGKTPHTRPKSMEVPQNPPTIQPPPTSPVLKRGFFQKVGRARSNSTHAPSSPSAVETLCQQSMTFDLGVSSSTTKVDPEVEPVSPVNSPPASPRPPRQRSRFLDAALQRSKRLFKVSKCALQSILAGDFERTYNLLY